MGYFLKLKSETFQECLDNTHANGYGSVEHAETDARNFVSVGEEFSVYWEGETNPDYQNQFEPVGNRTLQLVKNAKMMR